METTKTPSAALLPVEAQAPKPKNEKVYRVAQNFESIFLNQMVTAMRKTVQKDNGFIPESHAERMYQSMLDTEYASKMSESRQIGLADTIYEHLLRGAR